MLFWLTVPAAAFLNRVRGGGFGADRFLRGHPRLWAAPGIGLVAYGLAGASAWAALAWAVGYFVWSTLPVNRWDVLGRNDKHSDPTWIEDLIDSLADDFPDPIRDHMALFLRELYGSMPAFCAVALIDDRLWVMFFPVAYAFFAVLATEMAHRAARLFHTKFRIISEPLVGAVWGTAILIAHTGQEKYGVWLLQGVA